MVSAILTVALLAAAATAPVDAAALEDVRAKMATVVAETKTATWFQDVWVTNGKKEDKTKADCFWAAPDKTRLNVKEGRGAGATALYKDGKVTGFKPGMFSFVKLTYDVRDPEVLSVRGQDMRRNGFLDDMKLVLEQWPSVKGYKEGDSLVLTYRNHDGLSAKMWLNLGSIVPSLIESYENGKAVERYKYSNVVYNAKLDDKTFNP